jgi:hypothetical protein
VLLTVTLSQHVQESIEKHEWQIHEQHDKSSVDVSNVNSDWASSVPAAAARRAAQQWREIWCREDHNRLSTGTMAQSDVSALIVRVRTRKPQGELRSHTARCSRRDGLADGNHVFRP